MCVFSVKRIKPLIWSRQLIVYRLEVRHAIHSSHLFQSKLNTHSRRSKTGINQISCSLMCWVLHPSSTRSFPNPPSNPLLSHNPSSLYSFIKSLQPSHSASFFVLSSISPTQLVAVETSLSAPPSTWCPVWMCVVWNCPTFYRWSQSSMINRILD